MKSGTLKSKISSALFVVVGGSVLTVIIFMVMVGIYYGALNFDSEVAKSRVGLNVAIIVVSYILFGGGIYALARARLPDTLKAALVPVLVTVNIELVIDLILVTDINIPLLLIDGIVILGLAGYCFIKKLSFLYYLGLAVALAWHFGFYFMLSG